jgi:hypothetical protein
MKNMNKHEPKPLIEEHYHIQELIDAQDKRTADRNYHRDKAKEKEERDKLIADAKLADMIDYYCKDCKKDFVKVSAKQVEIDWTNPSQRISFYKARCPCKAMCIRLITDRHKDPYWTRSKKVARDRGKHYADTIQPYQTNFNLLYGKR